MDLSIIIVSYRGWKPLRECLNSLAFVRGASIFKYEVIIVDNDSDDGSIDEFKSDYPDFIFISNKVNGGFANGCNLGSTSAKGDYFLFLNPDTVASESEVAKLLVRAKENPGHFITSCRQVNINGKESKAFGLFPGFGTLTGIERAIYKILNRKKIATKTEEKNNIITPDWVSGSVMMIKKETFRKIGGFDEDFWMYYEDTDICRRARNLKGEIAYHTDITIQHNHGGSSRINLKTTSLPKTEVLISNHLYLAKHKAGTVRFLIQTYLVLYNLLTGFIIAFIGLLFFAVPKIFLRARIFGRLVVYYCGALKRGSWISPRSVNLVRNSHNLKIN
jgi:GT2 family glycosyltransferase